MDDKFCYCLRLSNKHGLICYGYKSKGNPFLKNDGPVGARQRRGRPNRFNNGSSEAYIVLIPLFLISLIISVVLTYRLIKLYNFNALKQYDPSININAFPYTL